MPNVEEYLAIYEQLLALDWPPAFVVEYTSGEREQLLRGDGVCITPPADDPEGIGGFDAELPREHPRNQAVGRYVRLSELRAVLTLDGRTLCRGGEPADADR